MSTDDARGVERELLAEALDDLTSERGVSLDDDRLGWLADYVARLIEQREAAARAEGRREVREAVERLADEWDQVSVVDEWDAASRWSDAPADLRAVLAGQGGESGEGA